MKKKNFDLLHDQALNKSLSFSRKEREEFGLKGLLPYALENQISQADRAIEGIRRKSFDIEKYIFLSSLQDRDQRLFYKVAIDNIEEIMPLIYTPTVGQACLEFSHIFRNSKGFYITPKDKGQIKNILGNWPENDIRIIVVTDGQRILGLGDLGANGMGIPIGKLSLYVTSAGIHPHQTLPIMLDVGTNNQSLLDDPLYIGYPHKRLEGQEYFDLVEEFVMAIQDRYPNALIQFEDFLTPNAIGLLNKYRDKVLCFNDDIQGTAAVALAGAFTSSRITNIPYSELKIMFLGAGSAATGIADLMLSAFMEDGLSEDEAYKHLWFVDSKGLIVEGRENLKEHNLPYAHKHKEMNFIDAIDSIKPHMLIGATGSPGTFTQEVIERMAEINERPIIFALSNPTSRAECTATQAYSWSEGRAVFSSGSPFDPVIFNGKEFKPGQGNNVYIFPGLGLGSILIKTRTIPDELFLVAAKTLTKLVSEDNILEGSLYPRLSDIRKISLEIAIAVAEKAYELEIAQLDRPKDLREFILDYMYDPSY